MMFSINKAARTAGGLYLFIAVLSIFIHFYVPSTLIIPNDAAATFNKIAGSEGLFRLGIGAEAVLLLAEVVLSVLLFELLKPVNKTLSQVSMVSRLIMTTIHGFNLLNNILVLLLAGGGSYLAVFESSQLSALAAVFLNAYDYGFSLGIVFLFLHAVLLGYLIYRSGYFPKFLGVLFVIASFGYLIDSMSHLLIANYKTGPVYLAIPITLAEMIFPFWLLIKGVKKSEWEKWA